jgi:hypothetical protein
VAAIIANAPAANSASVPGSGTGAMFQDDDGKAYRIYSSENNDTTYISLLTDDYLKHNGFEVPWRDAWHLSEVAGE